MDERNWCTNLQYPPRPPQLTQSYELLHLVPSHVYPTLPSHRRVKVETRSATRRTAESHTSCFLSFEFMFPRGTRIQSTFDMCRENHQKLTFLNPKLFLYLPFYEDVSQQSCQKWTLLLYNLWSNTFWTNPNCCILQHPPSQRSQSCDTRHDALPSRTPAASLA